MWPRLELLPGIPAEDGSIWVSIDLLTVFRPLIS